MMLIQFKVNCARTPQNYIAKVVLFFCLADQNNDLIEALCIRLFSVESRAMMYRMQQALLSRGQHLQHRGLWTCIMC